MGNMSRIHIDTLQRKMEAELAELVNETRAEMDPELKANYADSDYAVADTLIDTDNAIIGIHLQKAGDLNAALDRIQTGDYGVCTECGNEIDFKRLSAYPTAKRCVECQSQFEKNFASDHTPTL